MRFCYLLARGFTLSQIKVQTAPSKPPAMVASGPIAD
jgi:hypothetical protein